MDKVLDMGFFRSVIPAMAYMELRVKSFWKVYLSLAIPTQPPARAVGAFRSLGFDAGPLVGISFSITAQALLFSEIFGVGFCRIEDEGVGFQE